MRPQTRPRKERASGGRAKRLARQRALVQLHFAVGRGRRFSDEATRFARALYFLSGRRRLDHTGVAVYADPALWDPPSLPRFDFLMIESISYLPPERRMKWRREMKAIVKQSTPHFV